MEPDEGELNALRDALGTIISEYASLYDDYYIVTEWVLIIGATKIQWADGRQAIMTAHPNVPFSARLGLVTSAQADLLRGDSA